MKIYELKTCVLSSMLDTYKLKFKTITNIKTKIKGILNDV